MAKPKQMINTKNLDSKPSNQKTTFPETGLQHSTTLLRLRLCIKACERLKNDLKLTRFAFEVRQKFEAISCE